MNLIWVIIIVQYAFEEQYLFIIIDIDIEYNYKFLLDTIEIAELLINHKNIKYKYKLKYKV